MGPEIRVEEQIGFWLFFAQRHAAYSFNEALRACCLEHHKSYEVTPPQWGALSALMEQDGVTIGGLSQLRGMDAPTVTGVVKRLEASGLVERRHDLQDRRVVHVYLTAEGREIMRYLPKAVLSFSAQLARGLSETEQWALITGLQRIVANLAETGPGGAARAGFVPEFLLQAQRDLETDMPDFKIPEE